MKVSISELQQVLQVVASAEPGNQKEGQGEASQSEDVVDAEFTDSGQGSDS
jgi:hypothetical protein